MRLANSKIKGGDHKDNMEEINKAKENRPQGALPSNTEDPRKRQNEQVQAVSLRNGRQLEEAPRNETNNGKTKATEAAEEDTNVQGETSRAKVTPAPPIPYPQRFQPPKLNAEYQSFVDKMKEIRINIPLIEALQQMPKWVKFVKELVTKGQKLQGNEMIQLTEQCSAILTRPLPKKLGDPGEIEPTAITLQLADRSLVYPKGVLEDVLVKVDEFILPADFVILDMDEDREIPIILGRPFLATSRTVIDCASGDLTMTVHDQTIKFNVFNAIKRPHNSNECFSIDLVESCSFENFDSLLLDSLEASLVEGNDCGDERVEEQICWLDSGDFLARQKFESLDLATLTTTKAFKTSLEEPAQLEMKELPAHLKYAYLGKNDTLPVIISQSLSTLQE
ncbi:PREDICTED: uncharacterized protein LOC105973917 [Erythranthe guttata]|uniref:uncharacterized protein LOC105973917 n=1 Tax=Erythranthe guttata TaxID=4155 RepID=UPI00064DE1BC|nr:PREDICTED: uncharacterized protein LOC105973917 [Erythranthe guttata]|eukprot:XP_012854411.1 PREDICTED: uncharacterized protein LOC105973917 [Erythranthe guttata]